VSRAHWVVFPSADPVKGTAAVERWSRQGYKVCVAVDQGKPPILCDMPVVLDRPWEGYYRHINELVRTVFEHDLQAELVTCIGDDMDPDTFKKSYEIALMYWDRFPKGGGVWQACGDPQGPDRYGVPAAARICGSPTFDRLWTAKAHGGRGPFWPEYRSYYGDEDLWNVAKLCGALHLEPTVSFWHHHWSFQAPPRNRPARYNLVNSSQHWPQDRDLFQSRKENGFPGWELLEKEDVIKA